MSVPTDTFCRVPRATTADQVNRSAAPSFGPLAPTTRALHRWTRFLTERVLPTALEALEALGRLESESPPNWPSGLFTFVRAYPLLSEGLPIVWVPDVDTLTALVAAHGRSERQAILVKRAPDAVAHAQDVLTHVTCPRLRTGRELIDQALGCVLQQPAPAQALALQVAPLIWMQLNGDTTPGKLYARADRLVKARALPPAGSLRTDLTTIVFATVLARFNGGDTPPATPNRHVIAHAIHREQYTPANAISAVLLAVSVLRQVQAEHHTRRCPDCSNPEQAA